MNKIILILSFIFLLGVSSQAQVKCTVPKGFVCITQEAANNSAMMARESAAKDNKIKVLEDSLKEKDESIALVQKTATDSEAKLTQTIHDTELKLATTSGQIIECKATQVRDSAFLEFLVKNQRSKQNGVLNVKLGGN